jgi:2-polyprenyl-6-methoxyphenol hydroxylase-like FAD-dependent oxidoreductase
MTQTEKSPVLIIGAGPVGLTMAMDLAQRGIDVVMVETRHRGEPPNVKCNHVAARTMEIFRRLGVASKIRGSGLPEDYPHDVAYRTSFTGMELSRIPIPCRRDRFTDTAGPDGNWPTPEPPHRINQIYLEPILFEHVAALPQVKILNRTSIDDFTQDDEGVTAVGHHLDTGELVSIRCQYMVGCDGGRSNTRKKIGAKLEGVDVVGRVQSTYIRAPELIHHLKVAPAWATFSLNPRRCGNVYAIDGQEKWLIHNYLKEDETDFDSVDRDWAIRQILGVGDDFQYEILTNEDWVGRRLVADKFRDRRVFICGDAAHLWIPMAGYGMNAGIADAMNLSWVLAAHLNGWAGAGILDAYERERKPITEQVSRFAMNHAIALQKEREAIPLGLEEVGSAGDALRAQAGQKLYDLNVQQYCCAGLNFGYYYSDSSLIMADGETPPPYTMGGFTPSTVPGCRAPHFWLHDGRSLYDAFGPGYTLLRFAAETEVNNFMNEAKTQGVPVALLDIAPQDAPPETYQHPLVLCRADQHVVWRGDQLPANVAHMVARLRGVAHHAA